MATTLHTLAPGDEAALEAFLVQHADSSMFLRSNARGAGLADEGKPYQATYVAALEQGRIVAVAAHCWNGLVIVQAPVHTEEVARAAVERSGRAKRIGVTGPYEQVERVRRALGFAEHLAARDGREKLFVLELAALRVPAPLVAGEVVCRRSAPGDVERLARWRAAYSTELFGWAPGPALDASSREHVARQHEDGSAFVLVSGKEGEGEREGERGEPVSCTFFNARLPDMVQVGGVWTPPELRGRGHARAVVAGSLLSARGEGATRAILFTGAENRAAIAAYEALGFTLAGEYGLFLLAGAG
ncbi:GCN5 family acetyltransferase [Sorangium cellulosum]|uniref:GCN5 family acetyltransferase n=1 Tax=Sorangium cellulosum TaxID=56 RepID=A0A2L0EPG0_SORCE|nr:GNAT family N-acetyltransferase [Sorangium cellulosum]AUX41188.1 GCN5 family acetyltransferase [Sorangium cellulosum]